MIAQDELFESDYESLGYSTMNMEGRSRDNLVLHRRRFVFLTNLATHVPSIVSQSQPPFTLFHCPAI